MTSGIDMAVGETGRVMHDLSQHGQQLNTDWQAAKSAIAGNEGGIGDDVLGAAFRAVYAPDSTAVRTAADAVPGAIMTDAGLGHHAVGDYGSTDAGAAANLGSVGR